MYSDILTNKWVLGGVGFLIVLSVACVVWYQHDIADERKAAAEAEELLRQSERSQETNTDSVTGQAADESVESETPTAKKPINPITDGKREDTPSGETPANLTEQRQETEIVETVRVSPHGFGPYPEIPTPYRDLGGIEDIWSYFEKMAETNPDEARRQELAERVLVKLWNEGKRPEGATHSNGKLFPQYPNTVYVKWSVTELEDGTIQRLPIRVGGDPAFAEYELDFYESDGTEFPSGFSMLDYDKDGIDPYQFLDLP